MVSPLLKASFAAFKRERLSTYHLLPIIERTMIDTLYTMLYNMPVYKTNGNFGDSKSVGDGVFELRIHVGKGYRVYFTNDGKEIVILLVGGDKSSQDSDIRTAKKMAQEL